MSETMKVNEIKTTDDAIMLLKQLPGFECYHKYFETKLAKDFAFELVKLMSKREIELADKDKQLNNLREEIEGAIKMCGEYAIRASEGLCASLALSIGRLKHQIECELEHKKKLADCANTGMIANEKLFDQLTDARAEIERKNKLIEQMKNCYNCKFELHAAKECETCNTADCDDSHHYETSNWQPKEPEAAERGEEL